MNQVKEFDKNKDKISDKVQKYLKDAIFDQIGYNKKVQPVGCLKICDFLNTRFSEKQGDHTEQILTWPDDLMQQKWL